MFKPATRTKKKQFVKVLTKVPGLAPPAGRWFLVMLLLLRHDIHLFLHIFHDHLSFLLLLGSALHV